MDLLTCVKSVYTFLNEKYIGDIYSPSLYNMSYTLKKYKDIDDYDLFELTLELRDKLKLSKYTYLNDNCTRENLVLFYKDCILLLERKEKLKKLLNK